MAFFPTSGLDKLICIISAEIATRAKSFANNKSILTNYGYCIINDRRVWFVFLWLYTWFDLLVIYNAYLSIDSKFALTKAFGARTILRLSAIFFMLIKIAICYIRTIYLLSIDRNFCGQIDEQIIVVCGRLSYCVSMLLWQSKLYLMSFSVL